MNNTVKHIPVLLNEVLEALAPQATYTLEVRSARASVEWLLKEGLLS